MAPSVFAVVESRLAVRRINPLLADEVGRLTVGHAIPPPVVNPVGIAPVGRVNMLFGLIVGWLALL